MALQFDPYTTAPKVWDGVTYYEVHPWEEDSYEGYGELEPVVIASRIPYNVEDPSEIPEFIPKKYRLRVSSSGGRNDWYLRDDENWAFDEDAWDTPL